MCKNFEKISRCHTVRSAVNSVKILKFPLVNKKKKFTLSMLKLLLLSLLRFCIKTKIKKLLLGRF